jgi:hypothetical protein
MFKSMRMQPDSGKPIEKAPTGKFRGRFFCGQTLLVAIQASE